MPRMLRDSYPTTAVGHCCYLCNADQRIKKGVREQVVDLDKNIDMEGDVYFCQTCVIELGHLIGMVTADEVEELRITATEALADADSAEVRAEAAEEALEALRRFDATVAPEPNPGPAPEPEKPKADEKADKKASK